MTKISKIGTRSGLLSISILYPCIQSGLLLYDLSEPGAFLRGDRSGDRLETITSFLAAAPNSSFDFVIHGGVPGDYILHAALYQLGGPYLIILAQVLLQFVTVVATYLIAWRLTKSTAVTLAACLVLMVMPGTLMNPHLLTTETWFTAFLSLGTFAFCLAIDHRGPNISASILLGGFAAFALASFMRPQGLLMPLTVAMFLIVTDRRDWARILFGLGLSYFLFPISWMLLRLRALGDFGLGTSPADLGSNLLIRANRILSLPIEPDPPDAKLGILDFLHIAAAHPAATLKIFYSDALNLLFNPGSTHFFGYYLGLFAHIQGTGRYYWREIIDQSLALGVVTEILRQNSLFLMTFAIWTVIHGTVIVGVGIAVFRALRHRDVMPRWIWLVLTVVAVSLASVFGAGLVRWAHRSGIEPLLALLAAWGFFGKAVTISSMPKVAFR